MKNDGALYVFEGPDSVGKTTLARLLTEQLVARGVDCVHLAFPGNEIGTVGNLIYRLHHEPQQFGIDSLSATALQMLHVAAHVDAIQTRILPALALGKTVILDRFWWSTDVYGQLCGLNNTLVESIIAPEKHIWGETVPTVVFLLERNAPFEFPVSDYWRRCTSLYSHLADAQLEKHRIVRVSNEGEISTPLSIIMQAAIA
ncbi:AAA family ATPase [Rhodoferax sp.]|jgi:dTMP kinase|uniref:dTMP kinase n=1 Tax=Rhodoferax sp. TaxID=50421 RepID=UPI0025F923C5|nr:AAA family ATPase [Rhodoferax sp.]MCM2296782.1 AAA family ATPase [Rhodoferax sp.]